MQWERDVYQVDTDRERLDRAGIHAFLVDSYWARGVERRSVDRAIEHSICFGLYCADRQVGFTRVLSDRARFAYLADVYVLGAHRGRGLGRWLVACALEHPELADVWRWLLATADAHGLYAQLGFAPLEAPARFMALQRREAAR
ncbi:MAG: GNAT family N-acetyltransferase [Myxococcales bacterium]|nr:GNAT family N-acetyltransferase [Myxococcales bacterium]